MSATDEHPITAAEIAALRKATSVCFERYRNGDGSVVSQIRAIKEVPVTAADPFAQDVAVRVPTGHKLMDHGSRAPGDWTAFEMIQCSQFSHVWPTVAGLLRPGDVLVLIWDRDGGRNKYAEDAGLHVDRLELQVTRGQRRPMVFALRTSVCEDNTARMIRAQR